MAKRQRSSVLTKLAGKKLVFNMKFGYGEDSLKALAEAQGGTLCDELDGKIDYLVVADLSAGKTIQKKVMSLNAKGATIQVIDIDGLKQLTEPTEEEILALLQAGEVKTLEKVAGAHSSGSGSNSPKYTFSAENFKGVNLEQAQLNEIHFASCNFAGANLSGANFFGMATDCDFSKITGEGAQFDDVSKSRFPKASLKDAHFTDNFAEVDFTGAMLEGAQFSEFFYYGPPSKTPQTSVAFAKANLTSAMFQGIYLKSPDFSGADLTKASIAGCTIEWGNFTKAKLAEAALVNATLKGCDFTNADLTRANLAGADLTGSTLQGTNFKDANLRGTKFDRVDLSQAKNYDPASSPSGSVGPALKELDQVNKQAKRINVTFYVSSTEGEEQHKVGINSASLKWGNGVQMPLALALNQRSTGQTRSFSDAMLQLANLVGHLQVCYETLDVSSTKSPKGGKELRDLVLRGIVEAFAQEMPAEEELATLTKEFRESVREQGAEARQEREQRKAAAEKEKAKAKKQIAKKIEKEVGKVTDVASFLKALELRIEKPKIDKATKMLKASGFKLFNDVTDEHVSGVVKSQTDADLVYACRVEHNGQYSCCTQNLNVCGGLRGSICKHLLVLIIGLVQAGELDPNTIDSWIAKTHNVKPELDKENMGAIFIKYKGAEAGEVDWRPTETVPEDYYAF